MRKLFTSKRGGHKSTTNLPAENFAITASEADTATTNAGRGIENKGTGTTTTTQEETLITISGRTIKTIALTTTSIATEETAGEAAEIAARHRTGRSIEEPTAGTTRTTQDEGTTTTGTTITTTETTIEPSESRTERIAENGSSTPEHRST